VDAVEAAPSTTTAPLRVVVVGPCAAGKSTLAKRLRASGLDAYVCAQEHSEIDHLWRHLGPDVVIALDVDLATVRARRGADWPESIFRDQLRRLTAARAAAHLVIDTASLDAEAALEAALRVVSGMKGSDQFEGASTSTG
jgi:deoxyadenosine/deoxycytidine kinase